MKCVVAGASSVLGGPVISLLVDQGHVVTGFTRDRAKASSIQARGARARIVDVLDRDAVFDAIGDEAPDVVLSLLIALPKFGPRRLRDFTASRQLWDEGVPSLLAACQQFGVARFVAESMVFAYGYDPVQTPLTEDTPVPGGPPLGEAWRPMLESLRGMEQRVLDSAVDSGTTSVVLRYGIFHGEQVPHSTYMSALARWWMMPVPTGETMLSWVALSDAATATVAAATQDDAEGLYNVVDDEPVSFRTYMNALAQTLGRPKPLAMPQSLLKIAAPYAALAFGRLQLPVSNAKAKRELGWSPTYPTYKHLFSDLYR